MDSETQTGEVVLNNNISTTLNNHQAGQYPARRQVTPETDPNTLKKHKAYKIIHLLEVKFLMAKQPADGRCLAFRKHGINRTGKIF